MRKSRATVVVLGVLSAAASSGATMPEPVSPAGRVGSRCPSFSWSVDSSARGYEVVVYRVSADGEVGGEPVVSAKLPAGAASWTPSLEQCFASGERYAWTVRARGERSEGWSEPAVFEVAPGPRPEEVEAALEVLQRYLAERDRGGDRIAELLVAGEAAAAITAGSGSEDGARPIASRPRVRAVGDGVRAEPSGEVARTPQAASVPVLGDASLRLSGNVALNAASNVFKDGSVFLWDDTTGNTALGRLALASATGTATNNTAVGRQALRYTVAGGYSYLGSRNTAVGDLALRSNTTGSSNTASGYGALRRNTTGFSNSATGNGALSFNTTGVRNTATGGSALRSNTSGFFNTASGYGALDSNTTGQSNTASGSYALYSTTSGCCNTASGYGALRYNTANRNTAMGFRAGLDTTGSHNILINSYGVAGESYTLRIGQGSGFAQLQKAVIHGIRDVTTINADAIEVLIDSAGQLGTVSSAGSLKQDIENIGPQAERLLELRPVSFRYRQHVATEPDTPLQFGLIAEEVAEVFPELVVFDSEGKPQTVKYHLLSSLLLAELQAQHAELEVLRATQRGALRALTRRLELLELGSTSVRPEGRRKQPDRGGR
jgi:hypothetical protein